MIPSPRPRPVVRSVRLLVSAIVASVVLVGCAPGAGAEPAPPGDAAGSAPTTSAPTTSAPTASAAPFGPLKDAAPTGVHGAVHADEGYVVIGSGPKTVDLYVDLMCPYCKLFEQGSAEVVFTDAEAGRTTLRVHPLSLLDRLSQGTEYSTRAAALFASVSAEAPESAAAFLRALYERQPAENTPGLTDDELRAVAESVGVGDVAARVDTGPYRVWIARISQAAVRGPLDTTSDIAAVEHVPTVVVEGDVYPGDSDEVERFRSFYGER